MAQADPLVGDLFRREAGKISAWLARLLGPSRLDLIEDAVQDAFGTALARWPLDGVPDRAPVWIGSDRIGYINQGRLVIVDVHGGHVNGPAIRMQRGSLAGSSVSSLLAVESVDESTVMDVASGSLSPLPTGATGFAWSPKGDLAFLVPQSSGSNLYIAAGGKNAQRIASSACPGSRRNSAGFISSTRCRPRVIRSSISTRPRPRAYRIRRFRR